ncbi:hypothetical protein GCM10011577_39930 [Pseudarthrobacter polychromogenes]|uniref:Transposase n=1 Tax=Pseudarthrobacter polychromogenes TaxID=1676 RepID=A0ABQ1Y3Y1_9MICC|nr:hypothetical protein GCM10011577_39930 [Pseudarthrobacter polychromogenes]
MGQRPYRNIRAHMRMGSCIARKVIRHVIREKYAFKKDRGTYGSPTYLRETGAASDAEQNPIRRA